MRKSKNKSTILIIVVVIIVLLFIYFIYNIINKEKYSCIDYETNTYYTFKTESDMHKVCDKFNGVEDDKKLNSYEIYNDLINADEYGFTFDPYINSNNELSIIVIITDCNHPKEAKERAINWFKKHSYNIGEYTIEYEYPCE